MLKSIMLSLLVSIVFLLFPTQNFAQEMSSADKIQEKQPPTCQVIRIVDYPVTPTRSKNVKKRIALLNLCPKDRGMMARPMLPMMIEGKPEMYEYDVVRVFKNRKEAEKYAKANKITDTGY